MPSTACRRPSAVETLEPSDRIGQRGPAIAEVGPGVVVQVGQTTEHVGDRDAAGIEAGQTWASLTKKQRGARVAQLTRAEFEVDGKSVNKDEFVTCGGASLREIDFRTMESKRVPGLYFAGEIMDVDGITGGFNFQNAWTSGYLAGRSSIAV